VERVRFLRRPDGLRVKRTHAVQSCRSYQESVKASFTPQAVERDARGISVWARPNVVFLDPSVETLKPLEEAGWITVKVRSRNAVGTTADVALTDKGREESKSWKKIAANEFMVVTAQREFIDVTGITMPTPNVALAQYTWQWMPTDFGKKVGISKSEITSSPATFELFDDGWRLTP
jgi:hypothetical protein